MLALALAGSCAHAQSHHQTPPASADAVPETELAPVTVSAHEGIAVPYDATGVSVSILDPEELKKEGVYSVTEALTTAPGAYVLPGGGAYQRGDTSDLVIRGMSSQKYVLSMMDGMRLDGLGQAGLMTSNVLARTPLFGLGALELVRGAEGAVYGGGAMSGVLFMETPEGKGEPSASLFNEYGSFDSYTGNLTAQGSVKDTSFFLSSTYERTNNDFSYLDGSGPVLKHAGKYENWSQAFRLDRVINKRNRVTFTYRRSDSAYRNYTPPSDSDAENSRYEFRTNLVTAKYVGEITDKWTSSLMFGYYGSDTTFGARGTSSLGTSYQELDNVQLEWRNLYKWNEKNKTTAGLGWVRTDFDSISGGQENPSSGNLDSVLSVFAEHSVEPVKGWTNTIAARLDSSNAFDELLTLRAGTNYKFNRERTRVFATLGRGYAAPSSFQRSAATYKAGFYEYHGNPNLDCETDWTVDFGLEQQWMKDHFLSTTLFWTRAENAIGTDSSDYPHYYYVNKEGHQTYQGIELAARGTFEHHWNTGYKLACTLTQPKSSDDKQVAHSARQVWSADVHTSPVEKLTTGIGLAAACRRTDWGGANLDNYLILRWYANYEINDHLNVHLRVENLTNQKYVSDSGYPIEKSMLNTGTAVYGGCTVKF